MNAGEQLLQRSSFFYDILRYFTMHPEAQDDESFPVKRLETIEQRLSRLSIFKDHKPTYETITLRM